ncbi:MAG: FHA domain-containing protein [Acidobacteria bacterium]|nr:FHA domain-containing protein [Acidobacteriota bacterium]
MTSPCRILLVGLQDADGEAAQQLFRAAGHEVLAADGIVEAEELTQASPADVVYLRASRTSAGLGELRKIRMTLGDPPVVLINEERSADLALQAWHEGAADLIFLPLKAASLDASLARALRKLVGDGEEKESRAQAQLRYLDATGKELWRAIIPPRFTLGRSTDHDIVCPQMSVSRSHAEIILEGGAFFLQDLGSKHGTLVNGQIIDRRRLADGDHIQLGGATGQALTFHQGDLLQSLLGISEINSQAGVSVRDFREMGMLLQTLRTLSSISILDDLLSLVVDTAIKLTGAERGFIMLKEGDGDLSFRCPRNKFKQPLDGTSFQTSRRVPNEVFETGRRKAITDLDLSDQGDHSSTRQLGVRSIVCVPLRYWTLREVDVSSSTGKIDIIGVLYVDSPRRADRLTETQINAMETLATEAAMAIYNARLYKESQEKRILEEELSIAREIQQALLPAPNRQLPYVCAYSRNLPCREVGGDYFDYFELEDGRLGFAVGDVAGKGVSAALLTSVLQGIFSAQALLDLPPSQLIANVNRNLVRRGPGNRFVTLFFGVVNPEGVCFYSNAGHNPPLIVTPDGAMRELTEGGMVLGLFPEAEYEAGTVQLQPGDHLVLFTDGVLEARNRCGEEFGEGRLHALLKTQATSPAPAIMERILEAVESFSADTAQHDDITLMVLGYREAGPGSRH